MSQIRLDELRKSLCELRDGVAQDTRDGVQAVRQQMTLLAARIRNLEENAKQMQQMTKTLNDILKDSLKRLESTEKAQLAMFEAAMDVEYGSVRGQQDSCTIRPHETIQFPVAQPREALDLRPLRTRVQKLEDRLKVMVRNRDAEFKELHSALKDALNAHAAWCAEETQMIERLRRFGHDV